MNDLNQGLLSVVPEHRASRLIVARVSAGVFWSWNALFSTMAIFGILPFVAVSLFRDLARGRAPVDLGVTVMVIALTPLASLVVGWRLRRSPQRLMRYFYGLELPVFAAALLRLLVVRELTAPLTFFVIAVGLGLVAYASTLRAERRRSRPWLTHLQLAGVSVLAVGSLWIGAVIALWAVPGLVVMGREIFSFEWLGNFRDPRWIVLSTCIAGVSAYLATLLLVWPAAAAWFYSETVWREVGRAKGAGRARLAWAVVGVAALVCVGGALWAQHQPQRAALATLATSPASDAERDDRLAQADALRAGLLNAYLAPYRYLGVASDTGEVAHVWAKAFTGESSDFAAIQQLHDALIAPLLYAGEGLYADVEAAQRAYAEFFDARIDDGEYATVAEALSATYERSGPEASAVERNAEKVRLAQQIVTLTPRGDFAEVELFEAYANETVEQQEVVYAFALPASAVLTGLWLGNSADKSSAFVHRIAPRGAAQQVYRNEVQRRVDPALLEQVGPQQYRLRVFPIPAEAADGGPTLFMWLTYRTPQAAAGWPLPTLLERRNVFVAGGDERWLQVGGGRRPLPVDDDVWLPESLESPPIARQRHTTTLGGLVVSAEPAAEDVSTPVLAEPTLLIVDRSYSMTPHAAAVAESLAELQREPRSAALTRVCLSAAPSRGEEASLVGLPELRPADLQYYGGQSLSAMLRQCRALVGEESEGAVYTLTDAGGMSLEAPGESAAPLSFAAPLWLVHLGGTLPAAYADEVGDLLQRADSGIASSLREARRSRAARRAGQVIADGYRWRIEPSEAPVPVSAVELLQAPAVARDDWFAPLAARQVIGTLAAVDLDQAHTIAKAEGIVTPWSSMLVLVEERQHQALDEAEKASDRFEREGEDALVQGVGVVSGVPEPEEWLLIGVGAALLLWSQRRGRVRWA